MLAEASGFASAAPAAALVMSLVPAHIMRSMGGGFDNESIAVSAMVTVFWLWCRALRTPKSWWIGALAGLAHVYMVAAWGGYVFVINMVSKQVITLLRACFGAKSCGIRGFGGLGRAAW